MFDSDAGRTAKDLYMPITITEKEAGKLCEVAITGKLTKDDYQQFVPEIEELIKKFGKVRLLVDMINFHGWSAGGLWEDIKFDVKHFADIERIAFVGEKKWQEQMSHFCRPFTKAQIRYFDHAALDEARAWLAST